MAKNEELAAKEEVISNAAVDYSGMFSSSGWRCLDGKGIFWSDVNTSM